MCKPQDQSCHDVTMAVDKYTKANISVWQDTVTTGRTFRGQSQGRLNKTKGLFTQNRYALETKSALLPILDHSVNVL